MLRGLYEPETDRQAISATFIRDWERVADRFLAAGFCDPERFFKVLGELGIDGDGMPTAFHASLLGTIGGCGQLGYPCYEDLLMWGLQRDGVEASLDKVQVAIYSWGAAEGVSEFGERLFDFGLRANLHHGLEEILDDSRPIRETARELLGAVA